MLRSKIASACRKQVGAEKRVLGGALSSASVLALVAVLASAPRSAQAANECGAEGVGADTVTCSGTSFPNGITYAGSDGLNLVLNNSAMTVTKGVATDGVNLSGTTANDLTVTAASLTSIDGGTSTALTVNNGGDGKAAIVVNSGSFTANVSSHGTIEAIHNSGVGGSLVTMNGGQVSNTNSNVTASYGLNAEIAGSATGNATILMTGGSVQITSNNSNSAMLRAAVTNTASAGSANITMDAGTITGGGMGLFASNSGSGLAQLTINGGSITSTSNTAARADTSFGTGNAVANMTAGTLKSGSAFTVNGLAALANSGSAQASLSGGSITTISTLGHGVYAASQTGSATATMTGGTMVTNGSGAAGVRANVLNAASSTAAVVSFSGGSITANGTSDVGLYAQAAGSGAATIQLTAGASGNGGTINSLTGAQSQTVSGLSSIQMDAGTITTTTAGFNATTTGAGNAQIIINGGSLAVAGGYGAKAVSNATGNSIVTMTNGTITAGTGIGAYGLQASSSQGSSQTTFGGGSITTNGSNSHGVYASTSAVGLGSATATMTGGTVMTTGSTSSGVRAEVLNPSSSAASTVSMSGGSVTTTGQLATGLRSQNFNGLAIVQMTAGTVTASGNGADGVLATNQTGTGSYNISVTGGTVTGGAGTAAAVHGYSTAGGIITIGAGAILKAGGSGIALTNTGLNAGAAAITTAGTLTGDISLAATTNTLDITGGSIAGNINGGGNTALSFTLGAGNSFTYGAPYAISGVGGTTVNSGTVIMDGTLNGPVTIAGGTLQLGDGGSSGSIATAVTDNATLSFNRSDSITFANVISGTGNVVQAGSGTTILTGGNLYSGGTFLNAGILQVAADTNLGDAVGGLTFNGGTFQNTAAFSSARAVTVNSTGGTFQTDADLTLSGAISGAGGLTKTGAGTLIFTGNASHAGGTTITAGTLQLGNGGTSGSIAGNVTDNGVLAFNRSDAFTVPGAISGSGSVSQIGSGATTLSGPNGYTGGSTISAGTLIGSATSFGSGAILDNAALVIDQPADAAFANAINGSGSFTKQGAGRLNYTGTGSLTGPTTVAAGTLAVNGSLAGSTMTVQNGAALGGNGTVGVTTIQSGGAIAPGNSIGTLHINGAFVQNAGSIYQVEVDPNTNASDLIAVNGAATLQSGAGLNVTKYVAGNYQLGTVYKVLSATGGLSGTYTLSGQTTGVSAFLGLKDSYDANNAYLTVVQTQSLTDVATTPNQQAVATAVETLPPVTNPATGTPTSNPVQTAVLNLPDAPSARSAFDQLSGQAQASAQGALLSNGLYMRDVALDRLRDVVCATPNEDKRKACDGKRLTIWEQGFGGWGGIAGNGNATGLNHSSAGFLVGADVPVADWRLGFFGGYSHSDFNLVGNSALGDSNDYHLSLYGGTRIEDIAVRLGASYSWNGITTDRAVAIGSFSDLLHGVYNGGTTQAFGELGYGVDLEGISLEPFANLAYVSLHTAGFTEAGGAAALSVKANTIDDTITTLGVRPSMDIALFGLEGSLRGMAGWRHTFGTVTPTSQVSFAAGGNPFSISGAPIARDAAAVEAGLDMSLEEGMTLGLTYGGQFSSRTTDQMARGTVRVSF